MRKLVAAAKFGQRLSAQTYARSEAASYGVSCPPGCLPSAVVRSSLGCCPDNSLAGESNVCVIEAHRANPEL
eukprot:CAMPEP_0115876324 /NCGR_PEP_ID=MMETSP0287-20121206/25602_1 /TAXON_ID=412157 /ORGANISM="Chrysochromulina rotalis, Strain UIO044" /LENGTH=71 /DNA_ID=CAMNT_0003331711 /DNA_START=333 /DNA_END=544 /DNA_ORIENTATION=-